VKSEAQVHDLKNHANPGEQTGEQITVKISGIQYFWGLWGFIQ